MTSRESASRDPAPREPGLFDEADRRANETAFALATRSGMEVMIRAIRPTDADELVEGFEQLSPDSRYLRFFTPLHTLSATMLERFVHPDQVDHVAIGAMDPSTDLPEGIGVARAFRSVDDSTAAEFAVAVIDDYHSRGLGSLLLDVLGVACARVGITVLTAEVLSTNSAMLALVDRREGTRAPIPGDASVTEVRIPVSALTSRVALSDQERIEQHVADAAA